MAISAKLELKNPLNSGFTDHSAIRQAAEAILMDSYTVVDLDVSLKRDLLPNGQAATKASIKEFKITIRGTKELKTPFYAWVNGGNAAVGGGPAQWSRMSGTIHIYDSAGFISSTVQDVTGGDAPLDVGVVNDLATEEIEDLMNYGMDEASNYDSSQKGDIYDEMSKSDLIEYIADKKLDIKVGKDDNEETLRRKIRYYNKIEKMGEGNLRQQTEEHLGKVEKDRIDAITPEDKRIAEYKKVLREWNNDRDPVKSVASQPAYHTADKLKKATSKTVSGAVSGAMTRVLESARSIEFENALCLGLREHFQCSSKSTGQIDDSYPWLLELTILPEKIKVTGANILGKVAGDDWATQINFVDNMNNFPGFRVKVAADNNTASQTLDSSADPSFAQQGGNGGGGAQPVGNGGGGQPVGNGGGGQPVGNGGGGGGVHA